MRVPVTVSIEENLVEKVDRLRGLAARSRYVEMLIVKALDQEEGGE